MADGASNAVVFSCVLIGCWLSHDDEFVALWSSAGELSSGIIEFNSGSVCRSMRSPLMFAFKFILAISCSTIFMVANCSGVRFDEWEIVLERSGLIWEQS
jgi:hypothetical protein